MNHYFYKTMLRSLLCLFSFLLLFGCGNGSGSQNTDVGTGSISFKVAWVATQQPTGKVALLTPNAMPDKIVTILATVTAPNMSTIQKIYPAADHQGFLGDIHAGDTRTLTLQGLDSAGQVIYSGSISGINIVTGGTSDAGTVVMYRLFNTSPVANAGTDQNVVAGANITLDGSDSSDGDGDALTYAWVFSEKPAESLALLADQSGSRPSFIVDKDGKYVVNLTVTDSSGATSIDTVTITATDNKLTDPLLPSLFEPFDLNKSAGVRFDSNGIPLVIIWSTGEYQINPTTVAQWGLGAYARYAKNQADIEKQRFFKAADWLMENQRPNGGFPLLFDHNYPDPRGYQLKAPWYSAISQGNAISLLIRAYSVSSDKKYKISAEKALALFSISTTDGGLRGELNGMPWYEETPDPRDPNHIFNGFIFALLGIHDFYLVTGNQLAKELWLSGEASLEKNIGMYVITSAPDDGTLPMPWSIYDLQYLNFVMKPNYLTDVYMRIQIILIQEMYDRTGNKEYEKIAQDWTLSLVEYSKTH